MRWAGVPLKKRTTHAIAMPGTATCCCTSGVMTGGKSREWRKMTSDASAMTGQNRTVTSLHRCMTVVVIHLWQNTPRRTATVSCRIIWVHLFRLSTAREMWSGTCILDIYGDVLELRGERNFIPFRFQGQCEDQDQGLIDADSLNLNEIRRLQEEMLEHISNARKSGLNLNDYFKEGLHLRISSCK